MHNLHCTDECAGVDHDVVLQEDVQSEFARSRNGTVRVPKQKNKIRIEPKTPLKSRLRSRRFRMNSDPGSGPMAVASSTTATRKNQGAGKVATKFSQT